MIKHIIFLLFLATLLSASQKNLEKVSLRLQWLDQFQFAGYYMAKERGFYEDEGLDVEIKGYEDEIDVLDEVLSGVSTYGIGRSGLIRHYSEGVGISLVSTVFQSSPFTLIALESSGIKSVKDFADKTIMLTHDAIETASIYAMINISMADKKGLKYKEHTFDINELIDKKIDLYAGYVTNEPYELEKKGIKYRLFTPKDMGFDFYSDILFTSSEYTQKNPMAVQKFKRASIKGWVCAFENIEHAVDIIYKKYNASNKSRDALMFEAIELKKLAYTGEGDFGEIQKSKLERILDVYRVMGLAGAHKDLGGIIFSAKERSLSMEQRKYLELKGDIRVCVNSSFLPFSSLEDGKRTGIVFDILELAKADKGVSYTFVDTHGLEESLNALKAKKCDIVPMMTDLPKREGIKVTSPYHYERFVIVTDKRQGYIIDISSVMDKEFLANKNNPLSASLKEIYPGLKLRYTDSVEEGFNAVDSGKYYGYIDDPVSVAYAFRHISNGNLKISGGFEYKAGIGLGVRDDDDMLFSIFERLSVNIKEPDVRKIFGEWVSVNYVEGLKLKYIKEGLFLISFILFSFFYRQYLLKKKNEELRLRVAEAVAEIQKKDTYMLHKSRLAQMGEMISMIAHQWKQPLSTISSLNISMIMALELEQYDLCDKKQREEFLVFLDEKLKRTGIHIQNLSGIISDFSDFYRPNKYQEATTLNDPVLKSYWLLEGSLASKSIDLCLELGSKNTVEIFKNEFVQVIINIVNNAKEQFVQKEIPDAQITIRSYDEGDTAVLEISDNAGGIDESIIDKIFDPYFSTKFDKNGTGLGLHMSKNIIKQHSRGNIYAKNIDGGVVFVIEIGASKEEE